MEFMVLHMVGKKPIAQILTILKNLQWLVQHHLQTQVPELSASRHGAVGVSDVSNGYGYAMGGESLPYFY